MAAMNTATKNPCINLRPIKPLKRLETTTYNEDSIFYLAKADQAFQILVSPKE